MPFFAPARIESVPFPAGKELPSDVCEMTEAIASTALAAPVEERSDLHTKYATLVGEALAMATSRS